MLHYNINYKRFIRLLTPTFLRKNKILTFLETLISPLINLYNKFILLKEDLFYKINMNGQVVYLQKVLNDRFDTDLKRIYITDGVINEGTYVYTEQEAKPVYLGTQYIFNADELAFEDVDFIVILPLDLQLSTEEMIRMKALINYYKLASKTYKIVNNG